MTAGRRWVRAAALGVAAGTVLVALVVGAGTASASAYRYWSYWHGTASGGWSFSPTGATYRPPAGSVDGWRFAVSGTAGSVRPRATASFGSICGRHAPAAAGDKLVGLVVDYGTSADAPPGQHPTRGVDTYCAALADNGTSAQVLQAYASVRSDSGLVCAVDGYPVGECGVIVQPPTPKPSPKPTAQQPELTTSRPASASPGHSTTRTAAGVAGGSGTTGTPSGTSTAAAGPSAPTGPASGDPQPVAVGSGGVRPPDGDPGGPPVGALTGGALVLIVGGAAALRAARSSRRHGTGAG